MRIVLDTNVLVAGLLTPFGTCGTIVRMLTSGAFTLCVDARILLEYGDVLRRPRFEIDAESIDTVMDYTKNTAEICHAVPLATSLPDDDDAAFLEVAIAGNADCLVTGNLKHFPPESRSGMKVVSPQEFLAYFRVSGSDHSNCMNNNAMRRI